MASHHHDNIHLMTYQLYIYIHTGGDLREGVNYIEDMLYTQLVSAIGKEVTAADFSDYVAFHNRKLFKSEYSPKYFCHPVRMCDHDPEGSLCDLHVRTHTHAHTHAHTHTTRTLAHIRTHTHITKRYVNRYYFNREKN